MEGNMRPKLRYRLPDIIELRSPYRDGETRRTRFLSTNLVVGEFATDYYRRYPLWKATKQFQSIVRTFNPDALFDMEDYLDMARANLPDMEFVTRKITEHERDGYNTWTKANQSKFWQLLAILVENGYKVSLAPDPDHECLIFSIMGTKHASRNRSKCLSSRSDDAFDAYMLGMYKHFVLFDGGDWEGSTQGDNWG